MVPPKEESCALGTKRKLIEGSSTRDCKVARVVMEHEPSLDSHTRHFHCCSMQPRLADNCFNFLNSGLPRQIMFYNHGEWSDFPQPVVQTLIEGFRDRKSSTLVTMNNQSILIDLLSMTMVNLSTRKQRSVAWIDEAEKCFFPTLFIDEEADGSTEMNRDFVCSKIQKTLMEKAPDLPKEVIKQVVVESGPSVSQMRTSRLIAVERGSEIFLLVQNLFLSGMGPFATSHNILHIHRCSVKDVSAQSRLESFEKQIMSTKGERGDANVRYGWLGSSKKDIAEIVVNGFGMAHEPTVGAALGTGIYLRPEDRAFASVNLCDVDEKGIQYMLLCRAVLGNMEQVRPGSHRNSRSSNLYDSGVDDHQKPKFYVVWASHVATHIHPEYVISFKLSPLVQEYLLGLKDIQTHSPPTEVSREFSTRCPVICQSASNEGPTSPWMSLPVLFAKIQDTISHIAKELIFHHYEEFKRKKITREELVMKMRVIVGDKLLMSALTKFPHSPSSWRKNSNTGAKLEDPIAATPQLDCSTNEARTIDEPPRLETKHGNSDIEVNPVTNGPNQQGDESKGAVARIMEP